MQNVKRNRCYASSMDEEIVISGISGRFPNSKNVAEFSFNLYNSVDMIDDSERRWKHTNPNIPKRHGKIYDLDKFDANHFGVHHRQVRFSVFFFDFY